MIGFIFLVLGDISWGKFFFRIAIFLYFFHLYFILADKKTVLIPEFMALELMSIDVTDALEISARFHFQKVYSLITNTIIFVFFFDDLTLVFLSFVEFMRDNGQH